MIRTPSHSDIRLKMTAHSWILGSGAGREIRDGDVHEEALECSEAVGHVGRPREREEVPCTEP